MDLLREYLENELHTSLFRLVDEDDEKEKYTTDCSEFVVVDGEESDYGGIKYFWHGHHVATKTVHGGDQEEVEFTKFGKAFLHQKLMGIIIYARLLEIEKDL